jgi:peptidoglycan/LPS O-acetylase OafA/YrhL
MRYIRQLDSIRAIAVILVIVSHWIRKDHFINLSPNGLIGVDLFFVLSGFLITRILLTNRLMAESVQSGKIRLMFNFYGRRMLRIFPIYYITLFTLLIFHQFLGVNIQNGFPYFLTYTSNYYFFKMQNWDIITSHLWSLSVEEQFYIIWPLVMLFINRKHIQKTIFFFIICGVLSQLIFRATQFGDILTSSCFDAFGLGALLAWQVIVKPVPMERFFKITSMAAIFAIILLGTIAFDRSYYFLFGRLAIRIIGLWFITYTISREDKINNSPHHFLNNGWLMRLGKISYGIYLYHLIIPTLLLKLSEKYIPFLKPLYQHGGYFFAILLIIQFLILVGISAFSWRFIEKPFLNLKKYFAYGESSLRLPVSPHRDDSIPDNIVAGIPDKGGD